MLPASVKRIACSLTGILVGAVFMSGVGVSGVWAAGPLPEGLVLWLDATDLDGMGDPDGTLDSGALIARWTDKSGHDNHVEQQEPTRQPTLRQHQLGDGAVVSFGGDDVLTRDKFTGFSIRDQPLHILLIMQFRQDESHPTPRVLEFQPIDGDMSKPATVKQHGLWVGTNRDGKMRIETHYGDDGSALSVAWDNRPHVVEVIYEGAQRWIHYLDGARDGAGLLEDRDFHGFTKDLRLALGQHFGSEDAETFFKGDLTEVLVYDRVLSSEEQNAVKSYLSGKWSLDLSIEPVPTFERDVRPILAQHCHECHGSDLRESGVDLRTVTAMLGGGESGPVISRGHPEFSDLVEQIVQGSMPPDGADPLDENEIAVIRRWIEAGAPAAEEIAPVDTGPSISEEDRSFWSFQQLASHQPPKVASTDRIRTPIDAFVLAKLEPLGLTLAPEASRVTLLRRVFFDL